MELVFDLFDQSDDLNTDWAVNKTYDRNHVLNKFRKTTGQLHSDDAFLLENGLQYNVIR